MEHYAAKYAAADPYALSERSGAPFDAEGFHVCVLGQALRATWPDFTLTAEAGASAALKLGAYLRILVIRYLLEGVAVPPSGKFLSFREFPQAAIYDTTFQGRCVRRLASTFGGRSAAFQQAAGQLGGTPFDAGSAVAMELPFLGEVRVRLILHEGDDEFPPTAQFLFSDNAAAAFSAEDLAVVGDTVIAALTACVE